MSDKKKFLLRLDRGVFEAIEKWASDDLRSVNAQIEFLLTDAIRKAGKVRAHARKPDGRPPTDGVESASPAGQP